MNQLVLKIRSSIRLFQYISERQKLHSVAQLIRLPKTKIGLLMKSPVYPAEIWLSAYLQLSNSK